MARKRAPEHDWVCQRCGCPCNPPGHIQQVHVGGGQGMKACSLAPQPILRSVMEAEIAAVARYVINRNAQERN